MRAVWFDFGRDRPGRLLLCLHHLIVDGVSWRVLLADLAEIWAAVSAGGRSGRGRARPPSATGPGTCPHWPSTLHHRATPAVAGRSEPRRPPPGPLTDRVPDPTRDTMATTRTLTVTVPEEVVQPLLTTTSAALRTGPDGLMLAALALAAHRGRQRSEDTAPAPDSLLVDLEGHGRDADPTGGPDVSRTVGWFTTQYPARIDLRGVDLAEAWRGGPALAALARRVRDDLAALPNGASYGLLRHLDPAARAELAGLPQPPILFNYLGKFPDAGEGPWNPAPRAAPCGPTSRRTCRPNTASRSTSWCARSPAPPH
ncbi:condensation domain-containing protein [Streptomyces sp. M19]